MGCPHTHRSGARRGWAASVRFGLLLGAVGMDPAQAWVRPASTTIRSTALFQEPAKRSSHCLLILGYGRVGRLVAQRILTETSSLDETTMTDISIVATTSDTDESSDTRLRRDRTDDTNVLDPTDAAKRDDSRFRTVPFSYVPELVRDHSSHDQLSILLTMPLPSIPLDYYEQILRRDRTYWLGALSSTGVYGPHAGRWVDEETSPQPRTPLAQDYHGREQLLLQHGACILRCAGIYGGQQSALHTVWKQLNTGTDDTTPGSRQDDGITNRIHAEDLVSAIVAAWRARRTGVYNVADNEPAPRSTVMAHARELLESVGVRMDGYLAPEVLGKGGLSIDTRRTSDRSQRRRTDQKRVSNRKMRRDLVPQLTYPTYREGLQSILLDRSNPWWKDQGC